MASVIINKLTLEGDFNDVNRLLHRYMGIKIKSFQFNEQGLIAYVKNINGQEIFGYCNPETNQFKIDGQNEEFVGVPNGFRVLDFELLWVFPDFTEIIPIPMELEQLITDHCWCVKI